MSFDIDINAIVEKLGSKKLFCALFGMIILWTMAMEDKANSLWYIGAIVLLSMAQMAAQILLDWRKGKTDGPQTETKPQPS